MSYPGDSIPSVLRSFIDTRLSNEMRAHDPLVWVVPGSPAEEWLRGNRQIRPGEAIPGIIGEDFGVVSASGFILGHARNVSGVGEYNRGFIPGTVAPPSCWHCTYCGGMRPSATVRCEGCGASR